MSKGIKALIVVGCIFGVIALFFAIANIIPVKKTCKGTNPWRKTGKAPFICAHRGGSELNPENTQMAFDYAIDQTQYIDIVEFDVWYTKDNQMVIWHDKTLNRMACPEDSETVEVHEKTLAELRQYNLGRNFKTRSGEKPYENLSLAEAKAKGLTILTLDEFFNRYKNSRSDFRIALEVKEEALEPGSKMVDEVYALLDSKYPEFNNRVLIISFGNPVIKYHLEKYPERWCGPLNTMIAMQVASNKFGMNGLVQVDYPNIQTQMYNTAGKVKFDCGTRNFNYWAHKRNQSTTYWTINDEKGMKKLIRNNADIITTNAPDKLYKIIHGKEYWEN